MNVDVGPGYLSEVRDILKRNVPDITVWVFGSRVMGRAKRFSDLDLALVSHRPLPKETLWKLQESFSDSELPFRVDVVDLASVSGEFRSAVEKNHSVLQNPD
ncbi:MAG: nucleotidyltransferase domain-containing protein [Fibrobacterota bacterium]|nr:nucleotidyltransferase domain-containing protein [Fibrobacterota bacterium]